MGAQPLWQPVAALGRLIGFLGPCFASTPAPSPQSSAGNVRAFRLRPHGNRAVGCPENRHRRDCRFLPCGSPVREEPPAGSRSPIGHSERPTNDPGPTSPPWFCNGKCYLSWGGGADEGHQRPGPLRTIRAIRSSSLLSGGVWATAWAAAAPPCDAGASLASSCGSDPAGEAHRAAFDQFCLVSASAVILHPQKDLGHLGSAIRSLISQAALAELLTEPRRDCRWRSGSQPPASLSRSSATRPLATKRSDRIHVGDAGATATECASAVRRRLHIGFRPATARDRGSRNRAGVLEHVLGSPHQIRIRCSPSTNGSHGSAGQLNRCERHSRNRHAVGRTSRPALSTPACRGQRAGHGVGIHRLTPMISTWARRS